MANVTVIPATRNIHTSLPNNVKVKRKVAGYARVSTDNEEQLTSYEAQVDYYTNYIKANPDWEFVGVYTDEGISATNTKKRDGFNLMVKDALAGKIDLIVTKSVSRFARNTVDSLTTVRKLKDNGTEVYFEKENIYTFDSKGELLITIMSSLAQEERRSISENVTWGQRKRFADGRYSMAYNKFLGYDQGEGKNATPVVNPEQAKIVRLIYSLFMQGKTPSAIATYLTKEKIPTPAGKEVWAQSTVKSILSNEKYKGDALLQKSYTVDFLQKKTKKNHGEVQQYYVSNCHEAIIAPEEWDAVQDEIERRKKYGMSYSGCSTLISKIICGECGSHYGSKVWHSTDKYRKVILQCNSKYKNKKKCETPHISENEMKELFIKAYNILLADRDFLLEDCQIAIDTIADYASIEKEMENLVTELEIITEMIDKLIADNRTRAQDQESYNNKYNSYINKYEKVKAKYENLEAEKAERMAKANELTRFMVELKKTSEPIKEFDDILWRLTVDKAVVYKNGEVKFVFSNGSEITVENKN